MSEITERLKVAIADRYVIERELGAGGMATVYLAHDVKHDRKGPSHPALSNYARLTPEAL